MFPARPIKSGPPPIWGFRSPPLAGSSLLPDRQLKAPTPCPIQFDSTASNSSHSGIDFSAIISLKCFDWLRVEWHGNEARAIFLMAIMLKIQTQSEISGFKQYHYPKYPNKRWCIYMNQLEPILAGNLSLTKARRVSPHPSPLWGSPLMANEPVLAMVLSLFRSRA